MNLNFIDRNNNNKFHVNFLLFLVEKEHQKKQKILNRKFIVSINQAKIAGKKGERIVSVCFSFLVPRFLLNSSYIQHRFNY